MNGKEILGGYALVAKAKLLKLISVPFPYFEFLSPQGRIFAGDILWVKKKKKNPRVRVRQTRKFRLDP